MPCCPFLRPGPHARPSTHCTDWRRRVAAPLAAALLVTAGADPLPAQQRDSVRRDARQVDSTRARGLTTITVTGRADDLTGRAVSASQGRVGRADLRLRPLVREGELLEAVPGMILTQHSGDGKSNQMFVRGFNLDHGTDFETRIESMPMNMPTHAHGQGYTDLNLLIPELVDHLEYKLGPYYAELGDFGSAGGATLHLARTLAAPIARADAGAWGYLRTVIAGSTQRGNHSALLGGEAKRYDGPWDIGQGMQKFSGMGRYSFSRGRDEWSVLGLSYTNRWNASDQIPSRHVRSGTLSRFGQIDPTLGGRTDRHSLSASWQRQLQRGGVRVNAYAIGYAFNLWSNFTYFLDDDSNGDQIEQQDRRTFGGFDADVWRVGQLLGREHTMRMGLQGRFDDAAVGLYRTASRARTATVRHDDVNQGSVAAWSTVESRWHERLRTVLGVRADRYAFDVTSDRAQNSGTRTAAIASPKGSVVFRASEGTELYVGGGLGFHSNDARGSTISVDPSSGEAVDRVDPLVRSRGAEVGLRVATPSGFRTTVSLWQLALDSELLFVGDAGTTEPQGRSRRVGVTFANFWRPDPRLSIDADLSLTRARFRDGPVDARHVPGALENVIAAGVSWEPRRRGPLAVIRLRHFGAHPLIEDNSVRGTATTLVNVSAGYAVGRSRITASLLNTFGAQARDVQYYYASRLRGEPVGGVDDVHFHPAEPRQLRLGIAFGQ